MLKDRSFKEVEGSGALNPERRFLLKHVGFDKRITKAAGHYYFDTEGRGYLDFLAQYGAVPFGHNPPALWESIYAHGRDHQPSFVQPLFAPAAEELANRLVQLAPGAMRYAVFVNSGAEAVEASIKLARARTRRPGILSTVRGYHGKTLGALSATDNARYREPFLLDTTSFYRVPYDDLTALERRLSQRDIAAFVVEALQGEGGMRVPTPGYLYSAAEVCRKYGTLLVLDEVQTGLGRTGELFAANTEPGIDADVILLSKALGGGLVALGAMLCTEDAWTEEFGFYHSSTFANSQFACMVGCKALDMLLDADRAVIRNARLMGDHLQRGLDEVVSRHPRAFALRTGRALMQGLVLAPWRGESSYFMAHASAKGHAVPLLAGYLLNEHGIVTAPVFSQNATLRLQPSLTIERHEIERLLNALDCAGELITKEDFAGLLSFITKPATHQPARRAVRDFSADHPPSFQLPKTSEQRRGKFAFFIHPTDEASIFDTLPRQFANLDSAEKASWRRWMDSWFTRMYEPATVYHLPALRSRLGGYAEGWLIACPLTPSKMMRLRREEKTALMAAYLELARELAVDIVGLGAFTSVISRGGEDLYDAQLNITTGNSLTAIASVESLRAVVANRGRNFALQTTAVIGAAGSLGRVAALHLGMFSKQLILFGNPANPKSLQKLAITAAEIYAAAARKALQQPSPGLPELLLETIGRAELGRLLDAGSRVTGEQFKLEVEECLLRRGCKVPPILLCVDIAGQLGRADVVLSASGAGRSFIDPALFARDCIVCDVARPLDVLSSVQAKRSDVFVYEGGIMQLPENVAFGARNVLGYPRGYNLACLSETAVLALEGAKRSYSLGSMIDYDEALSIYNKSLLHGFSFAVLERGTQLETPAPSAVMPNIVDSKNDLAITL